MYLSLHHSVYETMNEDKPEMVALDPELTLLKIKANPVDPILFQTYYCAECNEFIALGSLFPATRQQHTGHIMAWLPGVDTPNPGQKLDPISTWLAQTNLDQARREWLEQVASKTSVLNWIWVCNQTEYADWLDYLDNFLERLAESWLDALNGKATQLVRAELIWQPARPQHLQFKWLEKV